VVGLSSEDPDYLGSTLKYDEVGLVAKSVADGLQLRLDVKTPDIGTGYANVIIDPYRDSKPMRGEIAFNQVQLKVFKPFIQDIRNLDGILSYAGKISGTLTDPLLEGEVRVKDASISMISLPVNLTNVQLYSSIRQNSASINGAFNSGRGVGKLTGSVDWKGDPRVQLKLQGDNLLIRQAPLITAVVTPDLTLDMYPFNKKLSLSGTVDVPRALISMPEASEPVVGLSSDVRVVREGDDQLAILKSARPWDIRADVAVSLGNQVIFQGFDSRIPLLGRVNLSQRGLETAMRANGAIGVSQRVKIEAYGQSLDLNRAIARFNGELTNPTLDIDANKSVQGSTVGVRVTGTASSPSIQIYNDAGLSEQEALNALITGRVNEGVSGLSQAEGFRSDVNNTIAAAGISLGLGSTRALTNQIGRSFGLTGLALDAQGTGDDTQVSVTGYITPDLYLRYGVGVFTPVNKLTLRYQVNQRLYLEASQSLERAIDLFYNWRF
jgi:translocation and assembly module TamB